MLPEMMRIDELDYERRRQLMADEWREIELLETWAGEYKLSWSRVAEESDIPRIRSIARSFKHDRFHADDRVQEPEHIKAEWAAEAVTDRSRFVFVHDCPVEGFIVVKRQDGTMIIDLVAVSDEARHRSVALKLVEFALLYTGCNSIRAGTQSTNEPAKRLYQSLGMSVVKRERTFHR